MKFLVRTSPLKGECFSSYIQRISKINFVGTYDLLRVCLREGTHFPQTSFSVALDICPSSFVELNKLASMLDISEECLENLTFIPIFKKLDIGKTTINHSRVLSNLIEKRRKFCPKCIEKDHIYKLIWQVKEIDFCPIHGVKLITNCVRCDKVIPILPNSAEFGMCPNCNYDLSGTPIQSVEMENDDLRSVEDWFYLLNTSTTNIKLLNSFTSEQSLALRLIFIAHSFSKEFTNREQTTMSSIMQIARNTKVSQTFIHLNTVLYFVRKSKISLEEFFTLEVPEDFINLIFKHKSKMIDSYACISPWCNYYEISGSLERTSTTVKSLKSGQKMKYYMFCNSCGAEYGLCENDNKLVERGNFINFAWNRVKNKLNKNCKFKDLSRMINTTEDKLRRAIIFLAANNLIDYSQVPIKIPSAHNPETLSHIKTFISQGTPAKQIQKKLGMKYNDFLFYWLSPEIRKLYLKNVIKRPYMCSSKAEKAEYFQQVINYLLSENKPITIKEICKELNICPETIRSWGMLGEIKKVKQVQQKMILENKRSFYIKKAQEIISDAIKAKQEIKSSHIYDILGVQRTVLVRSLPDVTQYIHKLILKCNKSYK